ncbi:hypothetical protein, partial [Polyangium sp. 15x6]|uniref:hypothetical protein n=1 Tax=Polyangium sp. 15x6 TaxID=3042687 RepID=UPI0032B407BB|nr:hypothetical protein [Polyangium sp. 15x6]
AGGSGASGGAGGAGGSEPNVPEAVVSLDPSFGVDGVATAAGNKPNWDHIHASLRLPDGKLLVAGGTSDSSFGEGYLFRANENGMPDVSFGEGGKVLASNLTRTSFQAVAVAPNGDILAAGLSVRGAEQSHVLVARFDATGKPVSSFGKAGLALGEKGAAFSIALQGDGKILVAGRSGAPLAPGYLVQRFLADGSIDPSFGQGGVLEPPFENGSFPSSVNITGDGKIVLCGKHGNFDGMAFVRLLPSGALDPSFDGDGKAVVEELHLFNYNPATPAYASSYCAVAPNGKILATGESIGGASVLRLDTDGKLDPTFGDGDGIATTSVSANPAESMQLLSDGKVLVTFTGSGGYKVARFDTNGLLDKTYGMNGIASVHPACLVRDITAAPDGSVIAAGRWEFPPATGTTLSRITPNGAQDDAYGVAGLATLQSGAALDAAISVRLAADGKIVSAGTTDYGHGNFTNVMLARHLSDGALDGVFGPGGVVVLDSLTRALGVALQPDGKTLVAGVALDPSVRHLVRLGATGALDLSFGNNGVFTLQNPIQGTPNPIAVDGDGRIVIGGTTKGPFFNIPYVKRLLGTGEHDMTFAVDGFLALQLADTQVTDLVVLADGTIIASGRSGATTSHVIRVLPTGVLDTSFGNAGVTTIENSFPVTRLSRQTNGGFLVAGLFMKPGDVDASHLGITRLDDKGALDMAFGTNGLVEQGLGSLAPTDVPAVVPLPDGSFFVATEAVLDRETMVILKYLPDGKPDASFGHGGRAVVSAPGSWGAYDGLSLPDGKVLLAGRGFSPKSGTDFGLVRIAP